MVKIPHNAFVFVGDGRKALVLRNEGDADLLNLKTELERIVRECGVEALVVVAPPRALADLRKAFHPNVKKRIVAEIDKDLTKHPVDQIEKHLAA